MVVPTTLILNLLNEIWVGFLARSMDPKRTSVFAWPFTPLKSFKAHYEETCPRLVHWNTHTCVFFLFEKVWVSLKHLRLQIGFLQNRLFNCLSKLIERVLCLKSHRQCIVQELKLRVWLGWFCCCQYFLRDCWSLFTFFFWLDFAV